MNRFVVALLLLFISVGYVHANVDSPLIDGAKNNKYFKVKFSLKTGADVDEYSRYEGQTALMIACRNGYFKIVRLLIKHGANINLCSKDIPPYPYSALMFAAEAGYLKIVKYLLKKGAKKVFKDTTNVTALSLAKRRFDNIYDKAQKRRYQAIIRLLGNPNKILLEASSRGELKRVIQALRDGAKINTMDKKGWTPLMLALAEGHKKVARYLRRRGGKIIYRKVKKKPAKKDGDQ